MPTARPEQEFSIGIVGAASAADLRRAFLLKVVTSAEIAVCQPRFEYASAKNKSILVVNSFLTERLLTSFCGDFPGAATVSGNFSSDLCQTFHGRSLRGAKRPDACVDLP
jgi:hypothetical protein